MAWGAVKVYPGLFRDKRRRTIKAMLRENEGSKGEGKCSKSYKCGN